MEAHGYSNADERLASIPIYESRESGKPIDFIGLPRRMLRFGKRHFGMLAKDDSMNNAGVSERDLMIFEVTDDIQSGDIVCYENDLVRRYVLGSDGTKWLMPANDNFSPVMISAASPLRAYGRLVMIIKIV